MGWALHNTRLLRQISNWTSPNRIKKKKTETETALEKKKLLVNLGPNRVGFRPVL